MEDMQNSLKQNSLRDDKYNFLNWKRAQNANYEINIMPEVITRTVHHVGKRQQSNELDRIHSLESDPDQIDVLVGSSLQSIEN